MELLTVTEVSKILKINWNKVYELIRLGRIQALSLGSLKIPMFEVEDFIRRNVGKDLSDMKNVRELQVS